MHFDIILHYSVQNKIEEGDKEVRYNSYSQPPPPDLVIGMTEVMEMILAPHGGSASQP